jgi:3-oxoacyl-[acyl-carrier protein] reductase
VSTSGPNVAGIICQFDVLDPTQADVAQILAVNLMGVYWDCAAAGQVMAGAGRGSIINMASAGAEAGVPSISAYSMSKAAVIALTRTVAAELGPKGVRCNSVAPGFVESPMTAVKWANPKGSVDDERRRTVLQQIGGNTPLRTTGETIDIAYGMLYLATDASRFTTDQVLRLNGGLVMA